MAVAVPSHEEGAVVPSPVTAAEAAALRADDVLARLGSETGGLPEEEEEAAARRLRVAGPNAVRSHRAPAPVSRPPRAPPRRPLHHPHPPAAGAFERR